MKLSPETNQRFEVFFRQHLGNENFQMPKTNIFLKKGAEIITKLLRVDGITIGRNIFIRPEIANQKTETVFSLNKNLLAHELAHVLQYQKLGFFRFLFDYMQEYFRGLNRKNNGTQEPE